MHFSLFDSLYKRDERCLFVYVQQNADDFQMFFPSEEHRKRFYTLVKEMTADQERIGPCLDLDVSTGGPIQVWTCHPLSLYKRYFIPFLLYFVVWVWAWWVWKEGGFRKRNIWNRVCSSWSHYPSPSCHQGGPWEKFRVSTLFICSRYESIMLAYLLIFLCFFVHQWCSAITRGDSLAFTAAPSEHSPIPGKSFRRWFLQDFHGASTWR